MKYTNRQAPEGINSGHDRPLRELLTLGLYLIGAVVLVLLAAHFGLRALAPHIPFSWERSAAELSLPLLSEQEAGEPAVRERLQRLADALSAEMALPDGMPITIHYSTKPVVNAFATLGGHAVIYDGLLARMPNENALATLLAHEIAHVKHRDVIVTMGSMVASGLVLGAVLGADNPLARLLTGGVAVGHLSFRRDQESAADRAALAALQAHYGHVGGYRDLFGVLGEVGKRSRPAFLASHPDIDDRIKSLAAVAEERGWQEGAGRRGLDAH